MARIKVVRSARVFWPEFQMTPGESENNSGCYHRLGSSIN